jgi:DNA-binding transcriptional MocR family regulator
MDRKPLWAPALDRTSGPLYLAIADAIAADVASGRLAAGARLPPQRALADALGVDFTTVSRAYAQARKRGLLEGRVGQGTYISTPRKPAPESPGGAVDMSMNLPPRFDDRALSARMWSGIGTLKEPGGLDLLLRYQEAGGAPRDRAAGARWLAPRVAALATSRVLVAPGAQGALLAVASLLARPGDTICTEALTYPGFRALAAHLGIRLAGVAMDDHGLLPDAFEALCRKWTPKAL